MDLDLFLSYTLYNDVLAFGLAVFFTLAWIFVVSKDFVFVIASSLLQKPYKGKTLIAWFILVTITWTWFYYAQLWSFI